MRNYMGKCFLFSTRNLEFQKMKVSDPKEELLNKIKLKNPKKVRSSSGVFRK